jgi:hypothetical protein
MPGRTGRTAVGRSFLLPYFAGQGVRVSDKRHLTQSIPKSYYLTQVAFGWELVVLHTTPSMFSKMFNGCSEAMWSF